jgi:hypothetical protein
MTLALDRQKQQEDRIKQQNEHTLAQFFAQHPEVPDN